jgi:hypothetical protein
MSAIYFNLGNRGRNLPRFVRTVTVSGTSRFPRTRPTYSAAPQTETIKPFMRET